MGDWSKDNLFPVTVRGLEWQILPTLPVKLTRLLCELWQYHLLF